MPNPIAYLQDRTFARATATTNRSYPPARRLTAEQLVTFLDRRVYAVVSTARPDGRPHTAMSVYARRDTTFWLPTMSKTVRVRNLREQPWLTLVVAEGDNDEHIVVIAEGPATTFPLEEVPADVRAAMDSDWVDSWIRLDAERVLSFAEEGAV